MYRAWIWWAQALEILSQARIQGLPKPEAWLRLKPGLVYHIWSLVQEASNCVVEQQEQLGSENIYKSQGVKQNSY
jgi:hypothetical protein